MTTEQIRGGGSMTVPQMIIPQIIYLDFDGAEISTFLAPALICL